MIAAKSGKRRKSALPMSLELIGVLEHQQDLFERKFGRPPQPGEPLFFDPECDQPRRLAGEARRRKLAMVAALTGLPEGMVAGF